MRTKRSFWAVAIIVAAIAFFSPNIFDVQYGLRGTTFSLGLPFQSFSLQHGSYRNDVSEVVWMLKVVPSGLLLDAAICLIVLILLKKVWWGKKLEADGGG